MKNKIVEENPFEDIIAKKVKKVEKPGRKPFTEEEIRKILDAFKNDTFTVKSSGYKHSHYYPFIFFMFSTGVRNSEAIGLRVKHIDLENSLIYIKESLTRSIKGTNSSARIRKGTKNSKERIIPLSENLKEVILPLLENKKADDLVFTSQRGVTIDDNVFQKRIFRKILEKLEIEHRVLYACRHTFASRCIQSGINPVTTAFLLGNM